MDAIQQYLDGGGAVLGLRTSNMHSSSARTSADTSGTSRSAATSSDPLDQPLRPQLPDRRCREYGCAAGVRRRDPDRFTVRSWLYRTELPSWCRPIPSGTLSTRKAPPAADRWPGAASSPRWSRSSPRTCSGSMPAGLTPPRSWLRCSASVETRCTADPSRLSSAASSAATLRSPVAGSTDRPDQDHPQPRPVAGQRPCKPR